MDNNAAITPKQRCTQCCKFHWRGVVLFLIPFIFSPILLATPIKPMRCAYILLVMASYWITEAMPIYVTALIPIVGMPLMGIMSSSETCMQYTKDVVVFFISSMMVAMAVEYSNLHTRIALRVIDLVGCSPRRLHFGIMAVTYFVSFWISNAAATAMMCPITKAILQQLDAQGLIKLNRDKENDKDDEPPYPTKVTTAFFLAIAYASSIGGCVTLIGTATNLAVKGLYDDRFSQSGELTFSPFIFFNFPPSLIIFVLTFFWLQLLLMGLFRPKSTVAQELNVDNEGTKIAMDLVKQKRAELGPMSIMEILVAFYFALMVALLFLNKPDIFPGYGDIINEKKLKSSQPTVLVAFLMFVTPATYGFLRYYACQQPKEDAPAKSIMSWDFFKMNFPWGVPLLLGGGFALSRGINQSGLALYISKNLKTLTSAPNPIIQLTCIIACVIFTAFSSNVAIVNIMAPILFETAVIAEVHPLYLALPAGMACSLAFHLPVSTPPNAIVSGVANIRTKNMAVAGIGPTLFSIVVYFVFSQFWGPIVFQNFNEFPDWAKEANLS